MTSCAVLLEPQLLDIMIVQFRNEKVSNHGSIPITIECNVVAFIVFEESPYYGSMADLTCFRRSTQRVFSGAEVELVSRERRLRDLDQEL
ncbi:hypothetical protein TNCV_654381 [Trichonephila clavipes]|nr:hypothetical protein TNCV_654381 [Trichonephila clavipes]